MFKSQLLKVLLCSSLFVSGFDIPTLAQNTNPDTMVQNLLEQWEQRLESPRRLVVTDLQNNEDPEKNLLGKYLSEQFLKPLKASHAFVLLERSQMEALLKEQGFQQSVWADPEQSSALGKLSGAELILMGNYHILPDQVQLNLRLIDVQSGEVLALSQDLMPKNDAIRTLLGEKTNTQAQSELAGQVLNLLLGQMKQHPTQTPAKPPAQQGIFYENFANLPAGTPLNQWGTGMVVRQSQLYPMHVMTTENPAAKMWALPLAFPTDFVLEIHAIDTLRDSRKISPGLLQVALRDQAGQAFVIEKVGHDFQMARQGVGRSAWRYQDWNVMALVKQGNRFSWYINGVKTVERTITANSPFIALEVHSPSFLNWAFTNISLHAL